jgi:hypothetical protein
MVSAAVSATSSGLAPFVLIAAPVLALLAYFTPSIVAVQRPACRERGLVLFVNVFTGWTVIGWAFAMFLAVRDR